MSALLPPIATGGRRRAIVVLVLCGVGQAAAAGMAAFATRDVFAALRAADAVLPWLPLARIAVAGAVIAWLRVLERMTAERVGQGYAAALRAQLFSHLARMADADVGERRSGDLAMRFVGDLTAVRSWVSHGIARLVSAGVVLPVSTAVLFWLEPTLGLAVAGPVLLGLVAMAVVGPRLGPAHSQLRRRRARLAADMLERVPHAPELRLLGRIDLELAHMSRRSEAMILSALTRARAAATLRAIPDLVAGLAAASLLATSFLWGLSVSETAGAMAALGLMIHPLRDLSGVWDRWRAWTIARDKCAAVLARPTITRRGARQGAGTMKAPVLKLSGQGLGLADGAELRAEVGQKIGIVGGNGAGKSTLLRLVAGIEQREACQVLLDGVDPRVLNARERRQTMALMSQRSPILAGSLRRALTMGAAHSRSDAEILEQAEGFGLQAVLARLGGLDGQVAEGGRNLSAGEARRVLLTRVALSGAQILLLDEPDELLDAGGVEAVAQFLRTTPATVLVVTHGLALARRMDALWVVEQARVVQAGPTAELLQADGPAARHFRPRAAA